MKVAWLKSLKFSDLKISAKNTYAVFFSDVWDKKLKLCK